MSHVDSIDRVTTIGFIPAHLFMDFAADNYGCPYLRRYGSDILSRLDYGYADRLRQAVEYYSECERNNDVSVQFNWIADKFNVDAGSLEDAIWYADYRAMHEREDLD